MKIPREVFRSGIERICDQECSRYALGGVKIECEPKGECSATASDGRRLVSLSWDDPLADKLDALISSDDWKAFSEMLPQRALVELGGDGQSDRRALLATSAESKITAEFLVLQGSFPKWRDVVPPDDAPETSRSITVNPFLLATVLRVIGKAIENGDSIPTVELRIDGPTDAVLIVGKGNFVTARGVLMPAANRCDK